MSKLPYTGPPYNADLLHTHSTLTDMDILTAPSQHSHSTEQVRLMSKLPYTARPVGGDGEVVDEAPIGGEGREGANRYDPVGVVPHHVPAGRVEVGSLSQDDLFVEKREEMGRERKKPTKNASDERERAQRGRPGDTAGGRDTLRER